MPSAIGIDIGGTNLRAARVSADGRLFAGRNERIGRDPEAVLERVIDLVRSLDAPDVVAIGAGIPGRVDARTREILSGGYVNFAGHRFAERVEDAAGKPVAIDNDATMALVAETAVGAAVDCRNVVLFTIGTGIGGAATLDGRIARGRAAAGQLGHLTVAASGPPCACGRVGCVETFSSGTALRRLVADGGFQPETAAETILDLAEAGDDRAAAVLDGWSRPLRAAIDSCVAAFDPELVLLGGGLGQAAHRALGRAPPLADWYRCPVVPAALGDEAGMIGAGLSALREAGASARPDGA